MSSPVGSQESSLSFGFPSIAGNEHLLFQIVDLFPMPIEIFAPDGTAVFVNRAFLEAFNISSRAQIVGHYNILHDPVVNDQMGLREYIRRAFDGETLSVSDVNVPLNDMAGRYEARQAQYDVNALYQDINSFPIVDESHNIAYIVNIFITRRLYQGRAEVAQAIEYIENHWFEAFDLEKVARAADLSKYHFCRLFKKQTGQTPYSYYQEVKVRHLKEKLRDKNLTIAQVFAACGVDYSGNYARIFKEKAGLSPSQYRDRLS